MIHQFILAAPKPGLTTQEFQDYWRTVHAVKFASRIPQIRRYLLDLRIPVGEPVDVGTPPLPHQGIAEIWLANEEEQLASLQSDEFIHGARADEPNWAAFWLAIVVDTTAHTIVDGEPAYGRQPTWVKRTVLYKRKPGLAREEYRRATLDRHAAAVRALPGLRRFLHCHTRDGAYTFGEPPFDSVEQVWFDDVDALRAAIGSPEYTEGVRGSLAGLVDPGYVFALTATESWIIR